MGGKNKGFIDKTNNRRLLRSSSQRTDYVTQPTDGAWISVSSIEPSNRRLGGFRSDVIYIRVDPYGPQYF